MKCKNCKREIDARAIFCQWCGERQIKERRSGGIVKVPKPRKLASGRWNVELRAEGVSITEDTPELCRTKAMAIRAGFIAEQKATAGKITLRQAIEEFVQKYKEALSPSTVRGYGTIKRNRFPGKMDQPITQTSGWQDEIDEAARTLATKTIINGWALVTEVMRAYKVSIPTVKIPAKKASEHTWLDPDQIIAFCIACNGHKAEREMLLGLLSFRRSEIFGLRWKDIDFRNNCINIRQVLVPNAEHKYVIKKSAKTDRSARTVPILIPRLTEILQKPNGVSPEELIFSLRPDTLRNMINRVCAQNNLPEVGTHGLRHSFASLAYFLGFREEECMRIGGWSDYKIMHEIYTHLYMRSLKEKENKMYQFYKTQGKLVLPERKGPDSGNTDFRS